MSIAAATTADARSGAELEPVALVDLLDRVLGAGVVLSGDIVISLAGVDLVELHLRAVITSARADGPSEDAR